MAKKHWIFVKRGLSENPKHRSQMGECIWLFMHMVDRADFETGIVYGWKDEQEAADMGIPVRTLREQRRKLQEFEYITCNQGQRGQDIIIHKWINPRDYSGGVLNVLGGSEASPRKSQGDTQGYTHGYTQGSSQDVTPTLDSISLSSLSEKDFKDANRTVDYLIESSKKFNYLNREKIPDPLLPLADVYFELTGQEPRKAVLHEWLMEISEWQQAGLHPEHIREAYASANPPDDQGFLVRSPRSLTKTAIAIKSKPKPSRPETHLYQPVEIKRSKMPPEVKERLDGLKKKFEVK